MKIVPSEFSNSAWNCFILAKEIAYKNHQQNVDSDNLFLALIKQDNLTKKVLMLGYMNHDSLNRTIKTKKVTFFSRSRNSIWIKGETSGNFLNLVDIRLDCDKDTLLIKVLPEGPVCHEGFDTCWSEDNKSSYGFLSILENIIDERVDDASTFKFNITGSIDDPKIIRLN